DCSRKLDSWVTRGFQPFDVLVSVRRAADDQQLLFGFDFLEGFNDCVSFVFWLQTAHVQKIFPRSNSQLSEDASTRDAIALGTIRNHGRWRAIFLELITRNPFRVADDEIGNDRGQTL